VLPFTVAVESDYELHFGSLREAEHYGARLVHKGWCPIISTNDVENPLPTVDYVKNGRTIRIDYECGMALYQRSTLN
jgi:hypothetical protein